MNFEENTKEKIINQVIGSHIEKRLEDDNLKKEELQVFLDYIKVNSKKHLNSVKRMQKLANLIIIPKIKSYTKEILSDSKNNYNRVLDGVSITQTNTIRENVKILAEQKKCADEYYDNIHTCIGKIVFPESDSCREIFKLNNKTKKVLELSRKYTTVKKK